MPRTSARLQTNLVGRKVHLITDEEARQQARDQSELSEEEISQITAERWWPALKGTRFGRFRGITGEIVQVHLDKDGFSVYTINFGGLLEEIPSVLFRIES